MNFFPFLMRAFVFFSLTDFAFPNLPPFVKMKKPLRRHRKLSYESSNTKVATVTKKGVIRAKAKGTCMVYVYAQNGVYKKIKVTVK